ncbi:hypothetical protein [Nitrincola alkalisediminis]|uniref:hypothetical protein n=1 Tax=Nitrincola alkalisediminis TaxID=1366656 RepID=UPI001875363E|nr:hypothetical protein [Nitrincola alkalisediminis]
MEWVISIVVMLSLVGSVMWIKPSPRERMQSQIRLHARALGFIVQIATIETPRAKGEMDVERKRLPAYRILRSDLSRDEKDQWNSWQAFRVENVANQGLPSQWSWKRGEGVLTSEQCQMLSAVIESLPESVFALESSPMHFTVYWRESGGPEVLDQIKAAIEPVLKAKF